MRKFDTEYVKNYFVERGYTPLFDEYVNNKTPLKVMCPRGHICNMLFLNFRKGHRCLKCANEDKTCEHLTSNKYTTEYVKNYFLKEGYTPLFDEYVNSSTLLKTKCPNGHIYYTNFNNFKNQGCRCRKCFIDNKKYTIEYVKNYFLKEGYTPLFDEYVNSKILLKTKCPNGHIYLVSFNAFKNRNNRCPICSNRKKYTTEYVKNYFLKEGYIPLFDKYINKDTPLRVKCPKGHICNISFGNFKNRHSRCLICHKESLKGSKCPNWKGGISCEPYCQIWADKEYKESIKKRDNYTCQNPCCCKNDTRLHIHHIDYNKKNCGPENLITLCGSCNVKANFDREWHKAWYRTIMNHKYGYEYK